MAMSHALEYPTTRYQLGAPWWHHGSALFRAFFAQFRRVRRSLSELLEDALTGEPLTARWTSGYPATLIAAVTRIGRRSDKCKWQKVQSASGNAERGAQRGHPTTSAESTIGRR